MPGLMTPDQMASLKKSHRIADGSEWERFAGLDVDPEEVAAFCARCRLRSAPRTACGAAVPVPRELVLGRRAARASTQEAFGRIMGELARDEGELAARIITTSPDVTVSTNLGAWVRRRSVFDRADHADMFRREKSPRASTGPSAGVASTSSSASPRTTCS